MKSKLLAVLLSAAVMLPAVSCAGLAVSAESALNSSWSVSVAQTENTLPSDIQRAFDEAMQSYNGQKLVPLAYYGLQVVAGYNYDLLCREDAADGTSSLKLVTIYDPNAPGMNGHRKAQIASVEDFNIADYACNHAYQLSPAPVCGGTEVPEDLSTCDLPDDVQAVYDRYFNMIDGMGCQPLAYLGKQQTDNGTDYALLCCTYAVVPEPDRFIDVLVLHDDGNRVSISSSYSLLGTRTRYITELTNYSSISSQIISLGNSLTVYAYAEGGTYDYTYAVLYKKKSDKKWTVRQNYSTNDIITVKPAKATDYEVCVKVKDSNGTIVKLFFDVTVRPRLTNTSTISATTIKKGNTVTVNGSATGGSGYYDYAVLYKKKSESKWTVRQGYKENDQILVRPYAATDYDICIKVRDFDTISKKYFSVTVKP